MAIKILITGGAGFIASSLADAMLEKGNYEIVLLDNFLTGRIENIPKNSACQFIECDVNSYEEVIKIFQTNHFDYVFHYAAVVGVNRTLDNPLMVLNDIQGIRNILELSRSNGVKRVFFSSSSEVYGEPIHLPQNEQLTPLNSRLTYAVVKNVGESFFRAYYQEFGLKYTIFRFFNTYGPKQSHDFVISKFLNAALNNEDITIYGKGSQIRTFCYISDNILATITALEKNLFINDVVNIGSDTTYTILELANTIINVAKSDSKIKFLPPLAEGDMQRRQPDTTKMKSLLGKDFVHLEDGLHNILQARTISG